jgi:hypothetical protein
MVDHLEVEARNPETHDIADLGGTLEQPDRISPEEPDRLEAGHREPRSLGHAGNLHRPGGDTSITQRS